MKIDLVITELFPGGAERCLAELAVGCAESGDTVRVCSIASLPTGDQSLLVDKIRSEGIELHSCHSDRSTQFVAAYRELQRWMRAGNADVCQTFLYHANVLGTAAARRCGGRVCVGGIRVAQPNRVREWIERRAIRRMDSVVCVSHDVQTFATNRLGCPPNQSVVIPNGVDVPRFSGARRAEWSRWGWPDDAVVILFVGRLHSQKGLDRLQGNLDRLVPEGSNRRLLIVGDGPQQSEIEGWIRGIGDDRVKRLPWQADIESLIRASRVLVLPSRYEGMPNVILEAMAAGRPVVCNRVEGINELLPEDSSRGAAQTYRASDESRMLDSIDAFCDDQEWSDEIGAANQAFVRNHFSINAMIDAYRQHYRSLLAR